MEEKPRGVLEQISGPQLKELFINKFGSLLSSQVLAEITSLKVNESSEKTVTNAETSEQKAERLSSGMGKAEFNFFQEYAYSSTKFGTGFSCQTIEQNIHTEDHYSPKEDDIVTPITEDAQRWHYRSCLVIRAIARLIDSKLVDTRKFEEKFTTNEENLYCAVGEKNGKTIIQGGGSLGIDSSIRGHNPSVFKIVFDDSETANEYLTWLQEKPYDALNLVFRRVFAQYDQQGKFVKTLFPLEGNNSRPFVRPVDKVLVKDLRMA